MTRPTEMSLEELGKTLSGNLKFHIKEKGGHRLVQEILDPKGKVIGGKRVVTSKGVSTVTYFLGDQQFETGERFLKAYQQQLREEEFEASKPTETTK